MEFGNLDMGGEIHSSELHQQHNQQTITNATCLITGGT